MTENGSVALKLPSLWVKKRAPWKESAPGLVMISTAPPPKGGQRYSEENMSGLTRMAEMELLGGRALPFRKPLTMMVAAEGSPPAAAARI